MKLGKCIDKKCYEVWEQVEKNYLFQPARCHEIRLDSLIEMQRLIERGIGDEVWIVLSRLKK